MRAEGAPPPSSDTRPALQPAAASDAFGSDLSKKWGYIQSMRVGAAAPAKAAPAKAAPAKAAATGASKQGVSLQIAAAGPTSVLLSIC